MSFRSSVLKAVSVALIGLPLVSGCGSSEETGVAEEPNVGPGGPAGGKANFNPNVKKTAPPPAEKPAPKK